MRTLIIIPAYNEERNMGKLVDEVFKYRDEKMDICIVNDCSTDQTKEVVKKDKGIIILNLPVNLGIGGAVQTGYKYAFDNNYSVAVQLDGDYQHDPKYLAELLKELNNGYDMVIGSRFIDPSYMGYKSTFMRRLGSKFISLELALLYGRRITDPTSGYRAINRKAIELFSHYYPPEYPEPESTAILFRNGMRIKEFQVSMRERTEGKSSITFFKAIYYMINVAISLLIDRIKRRDDGVII